MKIRLSQIPEEGKNFQFTTGEEPELDAALVDLLGQSGRYEVRFSLRPLDQKGLFSLQGRFEASHPEFCSRCGDVFPFQSQMDLHEFLFPKLMEDHRKESGTHGSHAAHTGSSDSIDASVGYEYEEDHFDLGEFLHEQIALAIPVAPAPELKGSEQCSFCGVNITELSQKWGTESQETQHLEHHPFAVLKNLGSAQRESSFTKKKKKN